MCDNVRGWNSQAVGSPNGLFSGIVTFSGFKSDAPGPGAFKPVMPSGAMASMEPCRAGKTPGRARNLPPLPSSHAGQSRGRIAPDPESISR